MWAWATSSAFTPGTSCRSMNKGMPFHLPWLSVPSVTRYRGWIVLASFETARVSIALPRAPSSKRRHGGRIASELTGYATPREPAERPLHHASGPRRWVPPGDGSDACSSRVHHRPALCRVWRTTRAVDPPDHGRQRERGRRSMGRPLRPKQLADGGLGRRGRRWPDQARHRLLERDHGRRVLLGAHRRPPRAARPLWGGPEGVRPPRGVCPVR